MVEPLRKEKEHQLVMKIIEVTEGWKGPGKRDALIENL